MANNILNTKSLIEELNAVWLKHAGILDQTSESYKRVVNSAKLPSNYAKAVKEREQNTDALRRSEEKLLKAQKKAERQRLQELKLYAKREKAFDRYERQLEREQRKLNRTQGLYNRIQKGINQVTLKYNDLAAKKALNGNLSDKELTQLDRLGAKLNKYNSVLKKVDSDVGKYGRNVGNYASGWNGLSNSINQLTREAPAFANSIQTGFMALSNNIPILSDEISMLIAKNKELQAQGKPTTSVFRQIMKSLFSFQTALSLGVTLLVLYGKEIGEWANSVFKASEAVDELSVNYSKLDEETKSVLGNLSALVAEIQDVNTSEQKRLELIGKLNDEYPEFNSNLLDEKNNTEALNEEIEEYIRLTLKRARAEKLKDKLGEKTLSVLNKEEEASEARNKLNEQEIKNVEAYLAISKENTKEREKALLSLTVKERSYASALLDLNNTREDLRKTTEEYLDNTDREADTIKGTVEYYEQLISANNKLIREKKTVNDLTEVRKLQAENKLYQEQIDLILNNTKKRKKLRRERTKGVDLEKKSLESWRLEVQKQIDIFKKLLPLYGEFTKEGKYIRANIKALEQLLNPLNDAFKNGKQDLEDWSEGMKNSEKVMKRLRAETEQFLNGFSQDFVNNSPLSGLLPFVDGTFEALMAGADTTAERFAVSFNSIAEAAQQAFTFINSLSQANFESQYVRLEQQRDVALQFAGESATARAEIEQQYDNRRRQIQRQQAKAQQDQAAFNVGIDTAQAIVATLAETPPPAGLPLAALMAGIGAAQLIAIKTQQIPQFWMGGEHMGGMLMMNDDPFGVKGANYREVAEEPSGKIHTPKGKNVKMNLPKGTIIHPTYDAFMNSLNHELTSNNIMAIGQPNIPPMIINQGLTKGEIEDVMIKHGKQVVKAINSKESLYFNYDERGARIRRKKEGHTTRIMNARYSGKGINV